MSGLIKGAFGYIYSSSNKDSPDNSPDSDSKALDDASSKEDTNEQNDGYLKRAVTGITSGVYNVGSATVGVGVSGVKWIAGTTYNVGSGVVGTVGSVAGGAAGTVVGAVGSGASSVISKVSRSKSKEHND